MLSNVRNRVFACYKWYVLLFEAYCMVGLW
jgi:hypothetical protein